MTESRHYAEESINEKLDRLIALIEKIVPKEDLLTVRDNLLTVEALKIMQSEFLFDTGVGIYNEIFSSGYPVLDLVNNQITTRTFLSSLEANGFLIDGHIIKNIDTAPLAVDVSLMEADSKSSTDEFIYILRTVVE